VIETAAEERKRLVGHLVAIDELCDEISSRMRCWAFADLTDVITREKCCRDLESLQAWSESTVEQHKVGVHGLMTTGDAVISQALQTLKLRGCAELLQGVESLITKLISQMKHPLTGDNYEKFNEEFGDLARLTQQIQKTAQAVGQSIYVAKVHDSLPSAVSSALNSIADKLAGMVSNVLKAKAASAAARRSGDEILVKQRDQAEEIKAAYDAMVPHLKDLVDCHKDAIASRKPDLALNLAHLFEDLNLAVGHCSEFLEQIEIVEHAATRLDDDLDTKADQLRAIFDEVRAKQREFGLLIDSYRVRIQLAPFRFIRRRGALPPLESLPRMDRRVLEVVIRLNLDDPEPDYFTTTRQRVETEIGDPSLKSSIERSLTDLCEKPQRILGRRPIRKSSTHQHLYFVISDALEFYAPAVRAIGLGGVEAP
jgi:hypothetical protein